VTVRPTVFAVCFVLASAVRVVASTPVDRFVESLAGSEAVPAEARDLIQQRWAKCDDCDGEEFLTQGLALFSERFRAGLDAYDEEKYAECAEMMASLESDADPFVAVHAASYRIKALVSQENLIDAGGLVDTLLTDDGERVAQYSYFLPEMRFLRGYCLLSNLEYQDAGVALERFLKEFPDAPQRLTIAAQQMLLELQGRQPGRMGDVVDLMHYSGRRLTHGDSGERVQQRQDRIVELLDKLIEEAEEQEKGGGGGSGNSRSRGRQTPQQPMPDSRLPPGQAREGSLREGRRANPAEMWGAMPPAERQRVLQALRESFPSRYRQLVEQYYEELGKKP